MKLSRYILACALFVPVAGPACRSGDQGAAEGSYATRSSRGAISFELTPKLAGD